MTQQIPDLFYYKDQHLRVSDIEGSGLHVASDFKIKRWNDRGCRRYIAARRMGKERAYKD